MKQITAVEWFEQQLDNLDIEIPYLIFAEAKELEKQQIIDAFDDGIMNGYINYSSEQYFKQTYEK